MPMRWLYTRASMTSSEELETSERLGIEKPSSEWATIAVDLDHVIAYTDVDFVNGLPATQIYTDAGDAWTIATPFAEFDTIMVARRKE